MLRAHLTWQKKNRGVELWINSQRVIGVGILNPQSPTSKVSALPIRLWHHSHTHSLSQWLFNYLSKVGQFQQEQLRESHLRISHNPEAGAFPWEVADPCANPFSCSCRGSPTSWMCTLVTELNVMRVLLHHHHFLQESLNSSRGFTAVEIGASLQPGLSCLKMGFTKRSMLSMELPKVANGRMLRRAVTLLGR